jgi:glycerol kinase
MHRFGAPIAVTGMAGDQQAATIGQRCLAPGQTKATYGTGAFVLTAMGETLPRSANRLLGTVLCQHHGKRTYALEGSVFVAGSLVKWLRDSLGLLASAEESEDLARSVPDSGGVVLVPALTGLGAPHWRPEARAALSGMSLATTRAHIARAALEAMAHQTADLAAAFAADGAAWTGLRVDGGMVANGWMVQDLADVLALEVIRPAMIETTALGAAMLAAIGAGLFVTLEEAGEAMSGPARRFLPAMDGVTRTLRMARWTEALAKI